MVVDELPRAAPYRSLVAAARRTEQIVAVLGEGHIVPGRRAAIGERRDWSVSEVFRRAVEAYVAEVPVVGGGDGVYALNRTSDVHEPARRFLDSLAVRTDVVIAELTLVELCLLIRNPTIFPNPYPAPDAVEACRAFRRNPNWRVVECRPVMEDVWDTASASDFARRRVINARLAFTLRAAGVTEFATRNTGHFAGFWFERVFDPLDPDRHD